MLTAWIIGSLIAGSFTSARAIGLITINDLSRTQAILILPVYLLWVSWPIPAVLLIVL